MRDLNRRRALKLVAGIMAAACCRGARALDASEMLKTRGVVLVPEDLSLGDWPERARRAALSTIAIHHQHSPQAVVTWAQSDAGRRFHERCGQLQLQVEYELHAMQELLPRSLFARHAEYFRMNEQGDRVADFNCCVHSAAALDVIAESALRIAKVLRPTTGRYFYWGDDGQPWCYCSNCRDLSPSDQALLVENHLLRALKTIDPDAQLAHLAYTNTLAPPRHIQPESGIFLEYAPIYRRYDIAYQEQTDPQAADGLPALDANLKIFPAETAQVLEYWLDVSRFSKWKRPAVKLPWRKDVLEADVRTYRQRGIRHITSFAVWVDDDYRMRFGEPTFIDEYGAALG